MPSFLVPAVSAIRLVLVIALLSPLHAETKAAEMGGEDAGASAG
jgi:hypothetical protein